MSNISITIFGGTGDLTYRKLMPAIYTLYQRNLLENNFQVCAIGRRPYNNNSYRSIIQEWIKEHARIKASENSLSAFLNHVVYYQMDFTNLEEYQGLNHFYENNIFDNQLVYFAVAPDFFEIIGDGLAQVTNIRHPKIILEKPFGTDLEHAKMLSICLEKRFGKEQIYRIDHYLGKEMVRNILTVRNTNPIFSHTWNKDFIDSVHISALETVGVETRGNYYDHVGALKDMVQNHLLQILSIVALDDPSRNLPEEQFNILNALRNPQNIDIKSTMVLGQYIGYRQEEKVNPTSNTETYVGLKLFIDHPRWQGVPFYIETGKRCSKREITVTIRFKQIQKDIPANVLTIRIQPVEGIYFSFNIKTPGEDSISFANMEFCQNCNIEFKLNTPEAYERMLLSCIENDNTWFAQWDQIEICWKYTQALKDLYEQHNLPIHPYEQKTDGPIYFLLNNQSS